MDGWMDGSDGWEKEGELSRLSMISCRDESRPRQLAFAGMVICVDVHARASRDPSNICAVRHFDR